jgi:hypothetical protein
MTATKAFEVPDAEQAYVRGLLAEKVYASLCDRALDAEASYPSKLLDLAGYPLVHIGDRLRVSGFADPTNGVKTITSKRWPAVYLKTSLYYPDHPSVLVSEASDWNAKPSKFASLLFPNVKERLAIYEKHFRGAVVKRIRYFGVRCRDSIVVDRDFVQAAQSATPAEHELELDGVLIEAFDQAQAVEIANSDGIPWTKMSITEEGEPTALGWHGQRPTVDELACFDRVTTRQRDANRRRIAREVNRRDLDGVCAPGQGLRFAIGTVTVSEEVPARLTLIPDLAAVTNLISATCDRERSKQRRNRNELS